jgi:hypothetical protein
MEYTQSLARDRRTSPAQLWGWIPGSHLSPAWGSRDPSVERKSLCTLKLSVALPREINAAVKGFGNTL